MKTIRNTFMAVAFVALAGCSSAAGSGGGAQPAAGGVAIQVTNDIVPPATVTIWMAPETGARRRLGTISPNGQQTFNFSPGIRSMEHRLVAEASGASDMTSNPFILEGVQSVQWNVSSVAVRTR